VGRPREHDEATAVALLDAAERILEAEGVDALSVRRVADEVGTTTRAVYSLFESKEGLLVALGARAFELLGDVVGGQRLSADPAADLAKAGLGFRKFALAHPALFQLAIQRTLTDVAIWEQFADASRRTFGILVARVQRVADAGLLGTREVHAAATEYHALCEGLAGVELRGSLVPTGTAERMWRDALSSLVAGWTRG
jgi:AcrR family transcriptional regulator